jgi:hypothetical protein
MTADFEQLLRVLCEAELRFILVGGLAATVHGSARVTYDIDVVYSRDPDNIQRLVQALRPLEPYLRGAPPGESDGVGADFGDHRNVLHIRDSRKSAPTPFLPRSYNRCDVSRSR